ncbi:MAG: beta-galactosidase [Cyclobacteriaceae bacterium]
MKQLIGFSLIFLMACQAEDNKDTSAYLKMLDKDADIEEVERYEGFSAGGGGIVRREAVRYRQAEARWLEEEEDLLITFQGDSSFVEGIVEAFDLPKNWRPYQALLATVTNTTDQQLRFKLVATGGRGYIENSAFLAPQETHTVSLDLQDLPLTNGARPPYEATAVRFTAFPEGSAELIIRDLWLNYADDTSKVRPVADQFGQRISRDWEDKISSVEEMRADIATEAEELSQMDLPAQRSAYGGYTGGSFFGSSGFFRITQDNYGRFMFVDPAGYPFWSLGVTGVRPKTSSLADVTLVAGREELFEELPAKDGPYADVYNGDFISFYQYNILRKWGDLSAWQDRVLTRFEKWGINTIGNWSDTLFLQQRRIPHTRTLDTSKDGLMVRGNIPDVFNPAWAAYVDSLFEAQVSPHKNDSMTIGWFVDNEKSWRDLRLLDSPLDISLRTAWVDFLQQKRSSLEQLNQAWNTNYTDWQEVKDLKAEDLPENEAAQADEAAFNAFFAEKYFSIVANTLKKYDPNHLYLGCRFTRKLPDDAIVRIAGEYCDVVSVNVYSFDAEQIRQWHELSQRPILISEHHLPLKTPQQVEPPYWTFSPEKRQEMFLGYVETFARMPFSLGLHWYQHVDQPLTGRGLDGENQMVGIMDITDQPHKTLVESMRIVSRNMYDWNFELEKSKLEN